MAVKKLPSRRLDLRCLLHESQFRCLLALLVTSASIVWITTAVLVSAITGNPNLFLQMWGVIGPFLGGFLTWWFQRRSNRRPSRSKPR